jgi:putative redox protein
LPLPADHPEREMVENAALTCPVHRSLLEEIEKPVRFHYIA